MDRIVRSFPAMLMLLGTIGFGHGKIKSPAFMPLRE
jgi:hypothetical protein